MDAPTIDPMDVLLGLYGLWLEDLPFGSSGRAGFHSRRYQVLYRKVQPDLRQRLGLWRRIAALEAASGAESAGMPGAPEPRS